MRAITIPSFGEADVLTVADVPSPSPGPGRVAIDVSHAGVNYAEVLFRRGAVPVELPYVPGIEVSGHVRAVGDGVTGLVAGQPVAALTMVDGGGYAEVAVTDARLVTPLPGDPTDAEMAVYAATASNTTTAFLALEAVARLRTGEDVLVHAAAGGLGGQVTQVARHLGAGTVTGTVGSARKRTAVRGCDEVLTRDRAGTDAASPPRGDTQAPPAPWAADDRRYGLVVDPVGGSVRSRSLERLRPGGRLLAVGNASGADDVTVGANELWFAGTGVLGHNTGAWAAGRPDDVGAALTRAVAAVASGEVVVDVTSALPLDRAAEAHRDLERGATTGKTVLTVDRRR